MLNNVGPTLYKCYTHVLSIVRGPLSQSCDCCNQGIEAISPFNHSLSFGGNLNYSLDTAF